MKKCISFEDQSNIDFIRKKLWCGREYGRASVMVGSGFSRNATSILPGRLFPLWNDLASKMSTYLYPEDKGNNPKGIHGNETLKLANEFEATFSRQALDDFLLKEIPDNNFIPGKLHELLLTLPWADIFTTNYDTLIERARSKVFERNYELVQTISDLPDSMKPRIIKLHGSFPSHKPFIITEEDYRTYPQKFSPFVNTVQQSLMETVLCLIGFSGDDPNFLYWQGWVRDNLGDSTPPIFLCGLLDISSSERRVLEKRKIIPIDLTPLFPFSEWPDNNLRYQKALEWFLLSLLNGEPANNLFWPENQKRLFVKRSVGADLPPILGEPQMQITLGDKFPSNSLDPLELIKQYKIWKKTRMDYPGWVIAPKENREILLRYTEHWINPTFQIIKDIERPMDLFIVYEINWRLEKSLIPLFSLWINQIIAVIKAYNPFPKIITNEEAVIKPDSTDYINFDWAEIGKCWVDLVFRLIKTYRQDMDRENFNKWMELIKNIVSQNEEWQARWYFEKCLFYLMSLNQKMLAQSIKEWPTDFSLPFWEVKRASILAELGEMEKAKEIAEKALIEIRGKIRHQTSDYLFLSQEGWAMTLLQAISLNEVGSDREHLEIYRNRWEKLITYKCNPWIEIDTFRLVLRVPLRKKPNNETTISFDPGIIATSFYVGNQLDFSDLKSAFAFLLLFEEAALPMKCGIVSMFSEPTINAAKRIYPSASVWAISSMIRCDDQKEIEGWFSRIRVASLSSEQVNYLFETFKNSLIQSLSDLESRRTSVFSNSFSQRQVALMSELLSRLCFRIAPEQLQELLSIAISMYSKPVIMKDYRFHECLRHLFKRVLFSMTQESIINNLNDLLMLPIPSEQGFSVAEPQKWVEPFNFVDLEISCFETDIKPTFNIDNLLRIATFGDSEARKRAIFRIQTLYSGKLLNCEDEQRFAQALWSRLDSKFQLPDDTGLYYYCFLMLPELDPGLVKKRIKEYIRNSDFDRIISETKTEEGKLGKAYSIKNEDDRYLNELLYSSQSIFDNETQRDFIELCTKDYNNIIDKAVSWWADEKDELTSDFADIFGFRERIKWRFYKLVQIMAQIILPKAGILEETELNKVRSLLDDMEKNGIFILLALPSLLIVEPNESSKISRKFRKSLNSFNKEEVKSTINGIYNWMILHSQGKVPPVPPDLIDELVNRCVARKQPCLDILIGQLSLIASRVPNTLKKQQIDELCVALEYLIKETEIPSCVDDDSGASLFLPIDEIPRYRELSARLAYTLYERHKKNGCSIPNIVLEWKEVCALDPLPEVRKAWPNNSVEDI